MWLFTIFLAIPLIEIALFIVVGGAIGLWPTLAIVLGTAVLGSFLVRQQGARALAELQGSLRSLNDPAAPLAEGAMILLAGALLLTPGFFTDTLGFCLLVPGLRKALFSWLRQNVKVSTFTSQGFEARSSNGPGRAADDNVIEGDYEEVTAPRRPGQPPSGWTRH
ncbi:MAG: FxsA family protein [Limimaricola sp.]|uniref:FxsA family protein n=1 Tax=Limimaricola sp. TaxID=2211665 RepID=UPI001D8E9B58|nr:FxsA family protein [Limimaricola sp.]MBI1417227.1 FxsA family protein [Limimaricola sp.]